MVSKSVLPKRTCQGEKDRRKTVTSPNVTPIFFGEKSRISKYKKGIVRRLNMNDGNRTVNIVKSNIAMSGTKRYM